MNDIDVIPIKPKKEYSCKRCLYTTVYKHCIRGHFSRSVPCIVVPGGEDIDTKDLYLELGSIQEKKNNKICEFCDSKYSSAASLCRHRKICKVRFNIDTHSPETTENNNGFEAMVERTVRRIIGEQNIPIHAQTNNIMSGNITASGNMINVVVNINAHGHENMNYLQPEFLSKCIMDITNTGIPKLIENVHLNSEHPENQNVKGKSARLGAMKTYNGTQWVLAPTNSVLDELIQKGCKVLYRHFNKPDNEVKDEDMRDLIDKSMRDLVDLTRQRKSVTYYKVRKSMFFMFFPDKPDDFCVVVDPDGQELVENTLNAIVAEGSLS